MARSSSTAARCRLFSTSTSSSTTVISETSNPTNQIPAGVALLTVDRAAQLNALSSHVMRDLTAAAAAADADPRVRAIVVTGSGEKAFAAGADVKELAGVTHDEVRNGVCKDRWREGEREGGAAREAERARQERRISRERQKDREAERIRRAERGEVREGERGRRQREKKRRSRKRDRETRETQKQKEKA